jgi:hypothetical protein
VPIFDRWKTTKVTSCQLFIFIICASKRIFQPTKKLHTFETNMKFFVVVFNSLRRILFSARLKNDRNNRREQKQTLGNIDQKKQIALLEALATAPPKVSKESEKSIQF